MPDITVSAASKMKRIVFFLLLFGVACSNKLHNNNSRQNSFLSNKHLRQAYDSILSKHKDYRLIVQEFEESLAFRTDNTSYPREVIELSSGKLISFATTNNQKVRETVSRLPEVTPVELLIELRNIGGEIKFQREILTENWIDREHFPMLLELAEADIKMPMITLLAGPPYGSDCIQRKCLLESSYARTNITIGFEALHMMKIYLKVGGGYPSSLRNDLNLMKEWYNSGLPKEAYKKMLDER